MRFIWMVIGVVVLAAGVVFTLQGLNILKGSVMTGDSKYIVIGPIVALVGLVVLVMGARRQQA